MSRRRRRRPLRVAAPPRRRRPRDRLLARRARALRVRVEGPPAALRLRYDRRPRRTAPARAPPRPRTPTRSRRAPRGPNRPKWRRAPAAGRRRHAITFTVGPASAPRTVLALETPAAASAGARRRGRCAACSSRPGNLPSASSPWPELSGRGGARGSAARRVHGRAGVGLHGRAVEQCKSACLNCLGSAGRFSLSLSLSSCSACFSSASPRPAVVYGACATIRGCSRVVCFGAAGSVAAVSSAAKEHGRGRSAAELSLLNESVNAEIWHLRERPQ